MAQIGLGLRYIGRNGPYPYKSHSENRISADDLEMRVATHIASFTEQGGLLASEDYERLIGFLADNHQKFEVVEAARFLDYEDKDRIAVFLRHDVDLDLCGSIIMSGIEQQHGFRSSYFILHNQCAYYGHFLPDGVFERFGVADRYIERIAELGQDVGLHIDPLGIIGWAGANGKMAMIYEINRLRRLGIKVSSVCSHNSNSVYNAMNQDVFAGVNLSGQTHVSCMGWKVPLGDIDAAQLGIDTLCDFLVTTHNTQIAPSRSPYGYAVDRKPTFSLAYDTSFSICFGKRWEVCGMAKFLNGTYSFGNEQLFEALRRVPHGSKIVLNIHPMYYGARMGPTKGL